jgi:VanZ family protein
VSRETASRFARNRPAVGAIMWWATAAVYAAAIFVMSSSPQPLGIQSLPPFVDKIIHAVVFGGFSLTIWTALRRSAPRVPAARLSLLAVLIAVLYGLSDEVHQSLVPGRDMDALDLVADGIGACLAQGMIVMRSAGTSGGPGVGMSCAR